MLTPYCWPCISGVLVLSTNLTQDTGIWDRYWRIGVPKGPVSVSRRVVFMSSREVPSEQS